MVPLSVQSISRREVNESAVQRLLAAKTGALTEIEARLLAARGADPEDPSLQTVMARGIADLEKGAARILEAIEHHQMIVVVADYDCDGATSCAVTISGLRALGATIDYVVPDRMVHGYGISPSVVDLARERFPAVRLIITVDNGILAHAGVSYAANLGLDVVVTDHHLPGDTIPADACAVINPSRMPTTESLREMAGVGVAAWLVRAVRDLIVRKGGPETRLNFLLPYIALGTVADLVPIGASNRALIAQGLKMLRASRAPVGVMALIAQSGLAPEFLTTTDIGFSIAPKINAAGRLSLMDTGINLLLTNDAEQAQRLAEELAVTNEKRKAMQKQATAEASEEMLGALSLLGEGEEEEAAIVAAHEDWHPGVVGLIASRLKEIHFRPAFAFSFMNGAAKGSGRSVPGFHLKDALEELARRAPEVLKQFGGHAMAAGVTLTDASRLPAFRSTFCEIARERLTDEMLARKLASDGEMPRDFTMDVATRLLMHPWGQRFEAPAFDDTAVLSNIRPLGKTGEHWRVQANFPKGQVANLVMFNQPEPEAGKDVPLYLTPSLNTWQGQTNLQWVARQLT